jgi:hypothetical protein
MRSDQPAKRPAGSGPGSLLSPKPRGPRITAEASCWWGSPSPMPAGRDPIVATLTCPREGRTRRRGFAASSTPTIKSCTRIASGGSPSMTPRKRLRRSSWSPGAVPATYRTVKLPDSGYTGSPATSSATGSVAGAVNSALSPRAVRLYRRLRKVPRCMSCATRSMPR